MSTTTIFKAHAVSRSAISIPAAQAIVHDLCKMRPAVYWADLLLTVAVGYSCAALYLHSPLGSAQQLLSFVVGGLALFRAGSFIHGLRICATGKCSAFRCFGTCCAACPC